MDRAELEIPLSHLALYLKVLNNDFRIYYHSFHYLFLNLGNKPDRLKDKRESKVT